MRGECRRRGARTSVGRSMNEGLVWANPERIGWPTKAAASGRSAARSSPARSIVKEQATGGGVNGCSCEASCPVTNCGLHFEGGALVPHAGALEVQKKWSHLKPK